MKFFIPFLLPLFLLASDPCSDAIQKAIQAFTIDDNDTKAAQLGDVAVQICLNTHGEEHENTLMALQNAGSFNERIGEPAKAQKFYEHWLAILTRGLGGSHKALVDGYEGLGRVFSKQGDYQKALAYHEKAMIIRQKEFGEDAHTANSYCYVGEMHAKLNNHAKATAFLSRCVEILEHDPIRAPWLVVANVSLADAYANAKEPKLALAHYKKALNLIETNPQMSTGEQLIADIKTKIEQMEKLVK